jgi:hypothetical protein
MAFAIVLGTSSEALIGKTYVGLIKTRFAEFTLCVLVAGRKFSG